MRRRVKEAEITSLRSKPGMFYMMNNYGSDDIARHFSVDSPVKTGDKIIFTVHGMSPKTGEKFHIERRYKHFDVLRNAFVDRLPGLYIPPIPKKRAIGNVKVDFVTERTYLLDKFVKQLARCPYLLESEEFRIFVHPDQNIDK